SEMIGFAIEVASGLAYAHRRGVAHRDLKPGNVLLTPSGVKIIDFGLGQARQAERRPSDRVATMDTAPMPAQDFAAISGTAGYLPPERLQGLTEDHRSDIFAFGALLYEMAAGRPAFDGTTSADRIAAILTSQPPPIESDDPAIADVDWVTRFCLKKAPDERWQSMADIEAILKRIASRRPMTGGAAGRAAVPRATATIALELGVVGLIGAAYLVRAMFTPASLEQRPI